MDLTRALAPMSTDDVFAAAETYGRVVHATCGWAAKSQNLSIYKGNEASTGETRLPRYAESFGAVEVDSSTYAIPTREISKRWVDATPDGFQFIVKAFGGFCASSVDVKSLPRDVRDTLATSLSRASYATLPDTTKDLLWRRMLDALAPMREKGKLAMVVFQFHVTQAPSEALREHILDCQARLRRGSEADVFGRINVAVEFRNRDWLIGDVGEATVRWCSEHDLCLVASDELEHETAQRDRAQRGLPPGAAKRRMYTRLEHTTAWGSLIRVHRRHGTTERVLDEDEIAFWARTIAEAAPKSNAARGPLYVAWGTEWLDAPLINAKALDAALDAIQPNAFTYDWYGTRHRRPSAVKASAKTTTTIADMFAAAAASTASRRAERAPSPLADAPAPAAKKSKLSTSSNSNPLAALWARAGASHDK